MFIAKHNITATFFLLTFLRINLFTFTLQWYLVISSFIVICIFILAVEN